MKIYKQRRTFSIRRNRDTAIGNFNMKGFLLTVNIKKAFDSFSLNFLLTVLEKYSFHPDFLKWIAILLKLAIIHHK